MARVHTTKANGQAQRKCGRCGHEVQKGETYYWAKLGFRTRRPVVRCAKHPFQEKLEEAKSELDDIVQGLDL